MTLPGSSQSGSGSATSNWNTNYMSSDSLNVENSIPHSVRGSVPVSSLRFTVQQNSAASNQFWSSYQSCQAFASFCTSSYEDGPGNYQTYPPSGETFANGGSPPGGGNSAFTTSSIITSAYSQPVWSGAPYYPNYVPQNATSYINETSAVNAAWVSVLPSATKKAVIDLTVETGVEIVATVFTTPVGALVVRTAITVVKTANLAVASSELVRNYDTWSTEWSGYSKIYYADPQGNVYIVATPSSGQQIHPGQIFEIPYSDVATMEAGVMGKAASALRVTLTGVVTAAVPE